MGMANEDGDISPTSHDDSQKKYTEIDLDRTLNLIENEDHAPNQFEDKNAVFRTLLLDLIHKLSNDISSAKQLANTTQEIVDLIVSSFPITFSSIELYDKNGKVTFSSCQLRSGVLRSAKPREIAKLDQTLAGEVFRRNATLIVSNKNLEEYIICPSLSQTIEIKHFIGIPIVVNAETLGVFTIASSKNISVDKETITWSETICHHLSALFTREAVLNQVEKTERIAHDMLGAINSPTLMCDRDGNILHHNQSFSFLIKQFISPLYQTNESSNILRLFEEIDLNQSTDRKFNQIFSSLNTDNSVHAEFDILLTRASLRKWYLVSISSIADQDAIIIMFVDVTKRKQVEEKLEYEVLHDPTSGLANRMLFHDELNNLLSKNINTKKPMSVYSLDMGRYGFIVESLGHDAADEVMCEVARRIEMIISSEDLIARIGSSEFALLMKKINNHSTAKQFANELVDIFLTPFEIGDQEIVLKPSIGIALTDPRKDSNADIILHDAHIAMTKSRDTNGDQIEFASLKRSSFAIMRLTKERELSKAIQRSQLFPFYQPEIDLASNMIVGAEALARWSHPKHGILAPKHFIDIAEDTNLIAPLFEMIFKQVLKDTSKLYDQGNELTIWTNISAKQFQSHNISQIIGELVANSSTPPHMIGIEITETALMKDPLFAAEEFKRMKALGIKIALDDFGTGYSSLSHLALFPVDMLKIDRSFVTDIASENSSLEIVSAVIGLAKGLRIKTLAEGIEDEAQLRVLEELGCDMGQGFLISRPSNFENFVDFTNTNSGRY